MLDNFSSVNGLAELSSGLLTKLVFQEDETVNASMIFKKTHTVLPP